MFSTSRLISRIHNTPELLIVCTTLYDSTLLNCLTGQ